MGQRERRSWGTGRAAGPARAWGGGQGLGRAERPRDASPLTRPEAAHGGEEVEVAVAPHIHHVVPRVLAAAGVGAGGRVGGAWGGGGSGMRGRAQGGGAGERESSTHARVPVPKGSLHVTVPGHSTGMQAGWQAAPPPLELQLIVLKHRQQLDCRTGGAGQAGSAGQPGLCRVAGMPCEGVAGTVLGLAVLGHPQPTNSHSPGCLPALMPISLKCSTLAATPAYVPRCPAGRPLDSAAAGRGNG